MKQGELPGLLVPLSLQVPTRFDAWELTLLARLQAVSGLNRSEIIRRCVRAATLAGQGDLSVFMESAAKPKKARFA